MHIITKTTHTEQQDAADEFVVGNHDEEEFTGTRKTDATEVLNESKKFHVQVDVTASGTSALSLTADVTADWTYSLNSLSSSTVEFEGNDEDDTDAGWPGRPEAGCRQAHDLAPCVNKFKKPLNALTSLSSYLSN